MKTFLSLSAVVTSLLLSACSSTTPVGPVAAQSENSNRAILNVAVDDETMTVSLTNTTQQTVAIDGEMEVLFDFIFVGEAGNCEYERGQDLGKPLSQRLVKLAPGETITKVFKNGDIRHVYSLSSGISVDGRTHLANTTMSAYRLPDFSRLDGIAVTYESGGVQAGVPMALADEEDIPLPEDLLHASVAVEVKLTDKYKFPMPPYMLRGDKDLPHFE